MKRRYLPTIGVSVAALAIVAGVSLRGCPEDKSRKGLSCVAETTVLSGTTDLSGLPGDTNSDTAVDTKGESSGSGWGVIAPQLNIRFSRGEKILFKDKENPDSTAGAAAITRGDYTGAATSFRQAVGSGRSEPEPQIYLNNAIANTKGNPYTLAVVVPVEGRTDPAKQILRGVADAQEKFNQEGGADGRLLEIAIVNDGNDKDTAIQVATELAKIPNLLGVIGHNSSSVSLAALPTYEKAGIAMISPTSSSTELSSPSFLRTIPSDIETGKRLALYTQNRLKADPVAIFYDASSSYSISLLNAFKKEFTGTVASEIDLSAENLDFGRVLSDLPPAVSTALLFPSTGTAPRAVGIARANFERPADQRLQLLGGDSLYDSTTLTEGGPAVEGLVLAVPWFANTPYAKTAEQRWGGRVSWRTASSYDATLALTEVLSDQASKDGVLEAVKKVQIPSAKTSGNPLAFEDSGNRTEDPLLVKAVRGGNGPINSEFGFELLATSE